MAAALLALVLAICSGMKAAPAASSTSIGGLGALGIALLLGRRSILARVVTVVVGAPSFVAAIRHQSEDSGRQSGLKALKRFQQVHCCSPETLVEWRAAGSARLVTAS